MRVAERFRATFLDRHSSSGDSLPELDGIRAMAALFVVFGHMALVGAGPLPPAMFRRLALDGVYIFFVLSAFLLTLQFLRHPLRLQPPWRRWAAYGLRRVARIYPLYAVTLAAAAASSFVHDALFGPQPVSILGHLALRDGANLLWTVGVEMRFYAVLPLLVVAYTRWGVRQPWIWVALLLVAIGLKENLAPASFDPDDRTRLWPFLSLFLLGHVAAVAFHQIRDRGGRLLVAGDPAAIIALVFVLGSTPGIFEAVTGAAIPLGWRGWSPAALGTGWAVFLMAVVSGRGLLRSLLASAPLRFAGTISFSIYLWHLPVLAVAKAAAGPEHAGATSTGLGAVAATLVVSTVSYLVIEQPALVAGARAARRIEHRGSGV
jgi:peptidoglycan/LPS O-acetylase OafA/YrhL